MINFVGKASPVLGGLPEPLRYVNDDVLLRPVVPNLVAATPISPGPVYLYPIVKCYYLFCGKRFLTKQPFASITKTSDSDHLFSFQTKPY